MTDKKKHFLDFKTFWDTVGEKRSHSGALEDINMLEFDAIDYNPTSDEYISFFFLLILSIFPP